MMARQALASRSGYVSQAGKEAKLLTIGAYRCLNGVASMPDLVTPHPTINELINKSHFAIYAVLRAALTVYSKR